MTGLARRGRGQGAHSPRITAPAVRWPATALLLVWHVGACDPGQEPASPRVSRDDAGVEAVRHGKLEDYGYPVYVPEDLVVIGTDDGHPETSFGMVEGLDVLEDGTIAVLDGHAGEVRTFAPDGSFIRRISRKGAGPGEISDMTLALVGVGQMSFALPDVANQSVTVFSADGEVVATHRFDIEETYIPEWRPAGDSRPAVRISSPASEVLALGSLDGSMSDTLAVVTRPPEPDAPDGRQPVWLDHLVWSFAEPAVAVAGWMFAPRFTIHATGGPVRTVSWAHESAALTEDEKDAIVRIIVRGMGMDDAEIPEDFRNSFRLPDRLPAMADIEVGDDLILVLRVRPVESMDRRVIYTFKAAGFGGRMWDAFSLGGEYLGALDLGAPADVYDIPGDTIIGVRENDVGLQQVFLARLPGELGAER